MLQMNKSSATSHVRYSSMFTEYIDPCPWKAKMRLATIVFTFFPGFLSRRCVFELGFWQNSSNTNMSSKCVKKTIILLILSLLNASHVWLLLHTMILLKTEKIRTRLDFGLYLATQSVHTTIKEPLCPIMGANENNNALWRKTPHDITKIKLWRKFHKNPVPQLWEKFILQMELTVFSLWRFRLTLDIESVITLWRFWIVNFYVIVFV